MSDPSGLARALLKQALADSGRGWSLGMDASLVQDLLSGIDKALAMRPTALFGGFSLDPLSLLGSVLRQAAGPPPTTLDAIFNAMKAISDEEAPANMPYRCNPYT